MTDTILPELTADAEPPEDLGPTGPEITPPPTVDPTDTFDVEFDDSDDEPSGSEPSLEELGLQPAAPSPLLAAFAAPAASPAFPGRNAFRMGKSHPAVTRLGELLISRGGRRFYAVGPGPVFGRADRNATAAFQRAQGWRGGGADGFPGPTTWNLLVTNRGKNIPKAGGGLKSPVPGFAVGTQFGIPGSWLAGFHTGADYPAPVGTPIVALVGGEVVRIGDHGAYGKHTFIRGDDGHTWLYAHQSRRKVSVGQRVKAGQVIGLVGATGNVRPPGPAGAHLHIEKSKHRFWAYGQVVKPIA